MPTNRSKPTPKQRSNRVKPPAVCPTTDPSKPKVFVASSTPGKRLAIKLADALEDQNIAIVRRWWTRDAFPAGAIILDALRDQAEEIDFAVVLFTPDDEAVPDVATSSTGGQGNKPNDGSKAPRDNCVFELGLFMGALGLEPKRSILLRHPKSNLLSDLGGLIYIDLPDSKPSEVKKTPEVKKLSENQKKIDPDAPFIEVAVEQIKGSIKDLGYCFNHAPREEPRIIPKERLMDLEKRGENLMDSDAVEVLVNTTQPMELNHTLAKSVCENMSADIKYTYFFLADPSSIKFFSSLVGSLAAAMLNPETSGKFQRVKNLNIAQWRALMKENESLVDDALEIMRNQLRIYFLPRKPHLEFCVHNANHHEQAICYLRHTADSFVEWFRGENAKYVANELRTCRFEDDSNIVFQGTQGYELYGHANQRFREELAKSTLSRFPDGDLRNKAREICFGDAIRICAD